MKLLITALSLIVIVGCTGSESTNNVPHVVPSPESAGGKIFTKFCGNCHAPPRVKSHKGDEWRNVVERMQTHRLKKAYHLLTDSEKETLITYLKHHSA